MITDTVQIALNPAGKARGRHWMEAEFDTLFLEHYPRVLGVLLRLVGDRARAEELANEVFWKLYRIPARDLDGRVGPWLYRTASNLGIDALRAAARRRKYEDAAARLQDDPGVASPLDNVVREEQRRRVRAVLASLRPAQAQILILRASGLSYQQLADVLQVKPGGIGTMLSRAQIEFRRVYLELYGSEEEL